MPAPITIAAAVTKVPTVEEKSPSTAVAAAATTLASTVTKVARWVRLRKRRAKAEAADRKAATCGALPGIGARLGPRLISSRLKVSRDETTDW